MLKQFCSSRLPKSQNFRGNNLPQKSLAEVRKYYGNEFILSKENRSHDKFGSQVTYLISCTGNNKLVENLTEIFSGLIIWARFCHREFVPLCSLLDLKRDTGSVSSCRNYFLNCLGQMSCLRRRSIMGAYFQSVSWLGCTEGVDVFGKKPLAKICSHIIGCGLSLSDSRAVSIQH